MWSRGIWEISVLSAQFFCECKSVLNSKARFLKKEKEKARGADLCVTFRVQRHVGCLRAVSQMVRTR